MDSEPFNSETWFMARAVKSCEHPVALDLHAR